MGVYTNTMRYTGTSGVDVESMVQALMKSEGTKADRIYRERQKLEWEQQMFRDMGTSVKTFNNNYLSFSSTNSIVNMRSTAAYSNKAVTGSFSGGESISTGSSANTLNLGGNSTISTTSSTSAGDYEFDIKSVATGDTYQSGKMSSDVVSTDALTEADVTSMQAGDYLDVTVNGTSKRLTLTDDDITRINDSSVADKPAEFAKVLQEKIDTQFGTISGESKVAVSINSEGKLDFAVATDIGATFSISASKGNVNTTSINSGSSVMNGVSDDGKTFNAEGSDTYTINGKDITVNYEAGQSKDDYIKNLNTALSDNGIEATATVGSKGEVVLKTTNADVDVNVSSVKRTDGLDGTGSEVTTTDADGNTVPAFSMSGTSKADAALYDKIGFSSTNLTSTFNVNQKIDSSYVGTTQSIKIGDKDYSLEITDGMTYKDVMNKVNDTGKASLTFNATTNSFKLQSKQLGENGKIDISGSSLLQNEMKLGTSDSTYTKGTNAEVHVKGPNGIDQTLIRETNSFSYADINFKLDPNLQSKIDDAKAAGEDGLKIEMSVTANTDQAVDNIKGFVDAYNTLLEGLYAATDTPRAKSGDYSYYEPLTDEEKTGMSDAQIEKMENKAKQGLLYRNPELTRLESKLRDITTTQVTLDDGSKMSLASVGITTGDYSQGGKLFIDEDKLRGALEKNPDGVAKLFTDSKNGVAEKMYNAINDAVGSDGYITQKVGFTDSIYSKNNYYTKQIEEKSKELDRMNDYLVGKENYYYSMFANMEQVISEANNQMAALSSY